MHTLDGRLRLTPAGPGTIGLAFELTNNGDHDVTITYFVPFVTFDLSATALDGEVRIIQPSFDSGVRPITVTILPGQTIQIATPIRLRFDPDVDPSGGSDATVWTLVHVAVPVILRATLQIDDARIAPCEATWNPD